jgi:hypothetical protein
MKKVYKKEFTMDFFYMLLNDPVVYYSIIGLGITAGIFCLFNVFLYQECNQ